MRTVPLSFLLTQHAREAILPIAGFKIVSMKSNGARIIEAEVADP